MSSAAKRNNRGRSRSLRWIPDQDDPNSVDDLFARNVDFRMERMSDGHYWMCIYVGDEQHHFNVTVPERSRTKIQAIAWQPAPRAIAKLRERGK